MTSAADALGHVRTLFVGLDTGAVALAAGLVTAMRSACDVLAPVADEGTEAGAAAAIAFQILADALAEAEPPQSLTPAEHAHAEALIDAKSRQRGRNRDGTLRRETTIAPSHPDTP